MAYLYKTANTNKGLEMKIGIISLGCAKNLADMEGVLGNLDRAEDSPSSDKKAALPENQISYEIVDIKSADIVFLNTCGFLKAARDEVYENLEIVKDKKVILIGCMTQTLNKEFFKTYPQVWAIVSSVNYFQISKIIAKVMDGERIFAVSPEPENFEIFQGKQLLTSLNYAYVKIAEGCDNHCTYCLIPSLKGKYRSRSIGNILMEIKGLIELGVKEIILVAQDCGYYGMDLYEELKLAELLKKIVKIPGDFWVRVLYVYPERITDQLLDIMAESGKICKYLDMPLQHGDSSVLKAMGRVSDVSSIYKKIEKIRSKIPNITLRTSLIVGFPGETDKAFENLLKFVKTIQFDHIGVFEYSNEKGTGAYHLKGQIPGSIKQKRFGEVMMLQQKISLGKNKNLIGTVFKTLIERFNEGKNAYIGRIERFAPEVDGVVVVKSKNSLQVNAFCDVKITDGGEYDLQGEIN